MALNSTTLEHLELANQIRTARARHLRDISAGRTTAAETIKQPPDYMKTCELSRVLRAMPHWGTKKANTLCARLGVAPNRRLEAIGFTMRHQIASRIPS
jgi:hypothetical protein